TEEGHAAGGQHLFYAEPIETESAHQNFSGDGAEDRRHRGQDSERHPAIEVERRCRNTDDSDDDQQGKKRERPPQVDVGPPQIDRKLLLQSFCLRCAQQPRPRPLAHAGASPDATLLVVGVLPHASRPKRLATMTSTTMTTVADTAMYASTDVKSLVLRRM